VANVLKLFLILVFGAFLTRSVDLMVVRGAYFRRLADENRVRRVKLPAARGRIFDRNGELLADNDVRYLNESDQVLEREQALRMQANDQVLEKQWLRDYPMAEKTAHLLGYLGEASKEEVQKEKYELGDWVGRGGVEEYYDDHLSGESGGKWIEVGAQGKILRELGRKEPVSGEDLTLTIDNKWQESAFKALSEKGKGAVVILKPDDGQVLSLVSHPSYDPNEFTKHPDSQKINQWLNGDNLVMMNRAISGAYHPGSVFKMIPAVAGLEEGVIDADKKVEDTGVLKVGEWEYRNWYWTDYGRTDGMVDLVKAIQRSNDIYFYKAGEWIGIDNLVKWMKRFNLGQKTGIDLPGEVAGFVPTPDWKIEAKGERWYLGNTYHLAIGQGDLTATPLQIALETAAVVNGGKLCKPHVGLPENDNCRVLDVDDQHWQLVKQGMDKACAEGGTAFPFFNFDPAVGCKTGTAQLSANSDQTHAWFTLFYPSDEPEIVMTVLLERGGSGSYDAAPVAKEIIERYEDRYEPDVDLIPTEGEVIGE
jgi:penicillin-binding protein 2